jgi:peptidoglycan/xylan/chitin deacetylase (PgdA/CDA1 family)
MKRSTEFLDSLGVGTEEWTLCYPYGAYDESAMDTARKAGFRLAFSTRVSLTRLTDADAFRLERLDTNDLPVDAGTPPNQWTRRALD